MALLSYRQIAAADLVQPGHYCFRSTWGGWLIAEAFRVSGRWYFHRVISINEPPQAIEITNDTEIWAIDGAPIPLPEEE